VDETAWNTTSRPAELLGFLGARISDRQLRLYACACYRRIWDRLHVATRAVVEVAEQLADGLADEEDLNVAVDGAWTWRSEPAPEAAWVASALPREGAERSAEWVAGFVGSQDPSRYQALAAEEQRAQCAMLRDVVGNPFRPIRAAPGWLTSEVVRLARAIYAERAFRRMGQLAEALVAAGCDREEILGHCLGTVHHVRGCWLLDLLLAR
jgi:hypothetical protein